MALLSQRTALWGIATLGDQGARLVKRGSGNPFPLYEQVRSRGPLVPTRLGGYVTTSHAMTDRVLRDDRFHTPKLDTVPLITAPSDDLVHPLEDSFLFMRPPQHTRLRRLVSPWFTPRAMAHLSGQIEQVVHGYLDELDTGAEVDLIPEFAMRVPVQVICDLLGVPKPEHDRFRVWARRLGPALDGVHTVAQMQQLREVLGDFQAFFLDLIEHRRRHPGDDLLSGLVQARPDGAPLSTRDLLATSGLLLLAGFGTTVNLIGKGTLALLNHPEARDALVAEPELAPQVVEESLRYDPPVHMTVRAANTDLDLGTTRLRKGDQILLVLAAANRDPAVFPDPARFDLERPNVREHLAFAAGTHFCVGAGLARMEGAIALRALFQRFPALSLAGEPRRDTGRSIPSLESLPVLCSSNPNTMVA